MFSVLFLIAWAVFGQNFDFSRYEEIDLFSYRVEEVDFGEWGRSHCFFRMILYFDRQVNTKVYFFDDHGDTINMDAQQRYSFQRNQKVIVYFNARRSGWSSRSRRPYGDWVNVLIDRIDLYGENSP